MKRIATYILALVVLLAIASLIIVYAPKHTLLTQSSTAGSDLQMTVVQIHHSGTSYTVSAEDPQFGIPAIDAQIKKAVEGSVAEFEATPPAPQDSASSHYEYTGNFDKVYVGLDVVSFELILSQYTGGAHNMTLYSGMNFDRGSGKRLLQDDAFKMIGLTVAQVSAGATDQLKAKLGDGFQFPEGANTNPENFSSFVISAKNVAFIFQEYQVAAYAAGPQQVSFERKR